MDIAVHATELDAERIDGTRVYLSELLKRLSTVGAEHEWHLYHRQLFNPALAPGLHTNYHEHILPGNFHWTQTKFVRAIRALQPERLFMPIQMLPFGLPRLTQTIVTIHDLAFKFYPQTFPYRDAVRHTLYTDWAVRRADKLIAITESTKQDLLKLYPKLSESKIRVIHHGFDLTRFTPVRQDSDTEVLSRFQVNDKHYILYVGALQPRKNLLVLLQAFAQAKRTVPDMQLVLCGARAWLWEPIEQAVARHAYRNDIVMTGGVSFADLAALYRGARIGVLPSLYEGFGLPILEAMASGTPVIAANNSSMPEVGGDAAVYFDATQSDSLADQLIHVWNDHNEAETLREKGLKRAQEFSWETTARETAEWIEG